MTPLVHRDTDATFLNSVLNHPRVRADVADLGHGQLDLTGGVKNENNVLLCGQYGACFFIQIQPGVYEVHTACLPDGRGRWVFQFTKQVVTWMFTRTNAFEIVTRIPKNHPAARMLAVKTGLRFEFSRHMECVWRQVRQDVDVYSFRIQDWATWVVSMELPGRVFHEFLHEAAHQLGISQQPHENDPQHNQYLGIALAMVEGDQPYKAANWYNRWAIVSRHPTVRLISLNPTRIRFDIGDLVFEAGKYRVEKLDLAA